MEFHKAIIRLGGIELMTSLTENLFIHMRAVRAVTMTQDNRAQRSIVDHRAIIAALAATRRGPGRTAGARAHDGAGGACREVRRFPRRAAMTTTPIVRKERPSGDDGLNHRQRDGST